MYSYDNREFTRFSVTEAPSINFFQKTFEEDTVYVAYYTPYNFSYLNEKIEEWKSHNDVMLDTIGITDKNFPIYELHVTDFSVPSSEKHHVWVHSRTHPGETPSSWHFDGMMQALLQNNEVIDHYKKKIYFHMVPFTNPEGVYFGRSRTNFDGIDVEANWDRPENETCTEVKILKARMTEINSENVLSLFLNLHSQAASYCTFWIHTAASTSNLFYRKEYQFSNINTSDNPYFSQDDYSESSLKSKFPEGWLWNNHGEEVMALTYETPYDHYSNNDWVSNDNLFEIGFRTIYSAAEYLGISHPGHYLMDNSDAVANGNWLTGDIGLEFFGDDFYWLDSGGGSSYVRFSTESLKPGIYDLYGWWPTNSNNSFNTRFDINYGGNRRSIEKTQKLNGGQWNFLTEISFAAQGSVTIDVNESPSGLAVADAFRLVYRGPVTSVNDLSIPNKFALEQNYPNPFNPSTTIRFSIAKSVHVELKIFNILGEEIATLVNRELNRGSHEVVFNTREFGEIASGIYFYRLSTPESAVTKKMNFVK
jgi:hypothetical protein